MNTNSVFFSSKGLTSSSAKYIAEIAKELIRSLETDLQNMSFVQEKATELSSQTTHLMTIGYTEDELRSIESKLERIVRYKGLIAWIREGQKEKDRLSEEIEKMSPVEVCKKMGISMPEKPEEQSDLTEQEYIDSLPIEERTRMYSLQAIAATYGKLVSTSGVYASARKDLLEFKKKPCKFEEVKTKRYGNGLHVVKYHEPSVDESVVDEVFFHLQNHYREVQAEYNACTYKVEETVRLENQRRKEHYISQLEQHKNDVRCINEKVELWKEKKLHCISGLKIAIPAALKEVYGEVNAAGKE